MDKFITFVGLVIVGFLVLFGLSILMAFFIMVLWNAVMPYLFHVPELDIWKALWLSILTGLLFRTSYHAPTKS